MLGGRPKWEDLSAVHGGAVGTDNLRVTEEPKNEDGVHSADSRSDGHRAEDSRMVRQSLAAAMTTDQPSPVRPAAGLTGTEKPKQNI